MNMATMHWDANDNVKESCTPQLFKPGAPRLRSYGRYLHRGTDGLANTPLFNLHKTWSYLHMLSHLASLWSRPNLCHH